MMIGRASRKAAEYDMGNAPVSGAKLRRHSADGDARRPIGWESIDAGRYRRKSDRCEAVVGGKLESGAIAGGEQFVLARLSDVLDRANGVNDIRCRQPIAARDFRRTGVAAAERSTVGQQLWSSGAVNGAVDPAAAEQRPVGGVDDRVGGKRRDIGDADIEPRRTDSGASE